MYCCFNVLMVAVRSPIIILIGVTINLKSLSGAFTFPPQQRHLNEFFGEYLGEATAPSTLYPLHCHYIKQLHFKWQLSPAISCMKYFMEVASSAATTTELTTTIVCFFSIVEINQSRKNKYYAYPFSAPSKLLLFQECIVFRKVCKFPPGWFIVFPLLYSVQTVIIRAIYVI